jgi:hypothetical protein
MAIISSIFLRDSKTRQTVAKSKRGSAIDVAADMARRTSVFIGGGPGRFATSLLLDRFGIDALMVEK